MSRRKTLHSLAAAWAMAITLAPAASAARLEFDREAYEFREDAGIVFATLRLVDCAAPRPSGSVRVEVVAADGSAREGVDFYGYAAGPIGTPDDGQSPSGAPRSFRTLEVPIQIVHDEESEGDESFELRVRMPEQAALGCDDSASAAPLSTSAAATVTLVDVPFDQSTVGFLRSELRVTETDPPQRRMARFVVERTSGRQPISVVCQTTRGGSAAEGEDFAPVAEVLAWGEGDSSSRDCLVPVLSDDLGETAETVAVALQVVAGEAVALAASRATLHIDDDDSPGRVQFESTRFLAREADGRAGGRVLRRGGTEGAVEVRGLALGREAEEGVDYLPPRSTARWEDGEQGPLEVELPLVRDAEREPSESIVLSLEMVSAEPLLGDLRNAIIEIEDRGD